MFISLYCYNNGRVRGNGLDNVNDTEGGPMKVDNMGLWHLALQ